MSEITLETVAKGLEMLAEQMNAIATSLNAVHKQQTEENKEDMLLEVLRREKQIHDTVSVCEDIKSELGKINTDELIDYSKVQFVISIDNKIRVLGNDWLRVEKIAEIVKAHIYKTFEQQNLEELNAQNTESSKSPDEQEFVVGKSPEVKERVIHEEITGNDLPPDEIAEEFTAGKSPDAPSILSSEQEAIPETFLPRDETYPQGQKSWDVPPRIIEPTNSAIFYPFDPEANTEK